MPDSQYVVQHGESLASISKKLYGTEALWAELAERNGLAPPYTIYTGQVLQLDANPGKAAPRRLASMQLPSAQLSYGRGFQFLFTVDQLPDVGRTHLIRKVQVVPHDFGRGMSGTLRQWLAQPERAGMRPNNPFGATSMVEHVLGENLLDSRYLSSSSKSFGAPNMQGLGAERSRPLLIDVSKLERAGGAVHNTSRLVNELRAFKARNPASAARVDTLIRAITQWEGEVLVEGGVRPDAISKPNVTHRPYIAEAERLWNQHKGDAAKLTQELEALDGSYKRAAGLAKGLRVVGAVGMVVTVAEVSNATSKSIERRSFKPIGAEGIRQAGSWAAAWGGAKIGALAGAAVGVETGPGAIVTGALGAIVFGAAGYFGADWIADKIDKN